MITLAKIAYTEGGATRPLHSLEKKAADIYENDVAPTVYGHHYGWVTVEPTPGHYNNNPKNKLAKVVHYINEPHTRHGFYAKLQVMPNGDLRSV